MLCSCGDAELHRDATILTLRDCANKNKGREHRDIIIISENLLCVNALLFLQYILCVVKSFVVDYTTNLVDSASSHMLVSRIKPCKSESKRYAWVCERLIKTETIYTVKSIFHRCSLDNPTSGNGG